MTTARHNVGGFSAEEIAAIGAIREEAAQRLLSEDGRTHIDDRFWLQVRLEGGDRGGLRRVPPLEVSPSGISYIWTEPVAAGTVATFVMLDRLGPPMTVRGSVMRCRHHGGRLHEVVAVFARQVDVDVLLDDRAETRSGGAGSIAAEEVRPPSYRRAAFDAIFERIAELTSFTPAAAAR